MRVVRMLVKPTFRLAGVCRSSRDPLAPDDGVAPKKRASGSWWRAQPSTLSLQLMAWASTSQAAGASFKGSEGEGAKPLPSQPMGSAKDCVRSGWLVHPW